MAKITNVIEKQNFEIIRDRIGAILYTEIKNQLQLTNNDILKCDIFVERNTPVDKIEVPTIIVSLASINFDNKNQFEKIKNTETRSGQDDFCEKLCDFNSE